MFEILSKLSPALGITTIISDLVKTAMGVFTGTTKENIDIKKLEIELQKAFMDKNSKDLELLVSLAKEQSAQNIELAKRGKLGARSWLFNGVVIIFLVLLGYVVALLIAISFAASFLTMDTTAFEKALNIISSTNLLEWIWGICSFMSGGLYVARGLEMKSYAKMKFDIDKFFAEYRKLKGSLTQNEVDVLNEVFARVLS
jgi:hypothetical protein